MSIKNSLGVMPEIFKRDSPTGAGRPKGIAKTGGAVDRKKQFKVGMANLMEVYPLGQSPKCKVQPSIIHIKEW